MTLNNMSKSIMNVICKCIVAYLLNHTHHSQFNKFTEERIPRLLCFLKKIHSKHRYHRTCICLNDGLGRKTKFWPITTHMTILGLNNTHIHFTTGMLYSIYYII